MEDKLVEEKMELTQPIFKDIVVLDEESKISERKEDLNKNYYYEIRLNRTKFDYILFKNYYVASIQKD